MVEVSVNFSIRKEEKKLYNYLRELNGLHVVTISKATRRQNWNRYYWGVIVKLGAEHCGYTPKEMHEEYKRLYNAVYERDKQGRESIKPGSTAKLYQDEFEKYCFLCQWHNSEFLGVYTPDIWEIAQA